MEKVNKNQKKSLNIIFFVVYNYKIVFLSVSIYQRGYFNETGRKSKIFCNTFITEKT
jgi:hypothetical protein